MDIGQSVATMREGKQVARAGWNGKGMWLFLIPAQDGEALSIPMQEFVVMRTVQGTLVPWVCAQTDLLATDWEIVT
jgi:hypothetical protein